MLAAFAGASIDIRAIRSEEEAAYDPNLGAQSLGGPRHKRQESTGPVVQPPGRCFSH